MSFYTYARCYGSKLYYRGIDDERGRICEPIGYTPTLFRANPSAKMETPFRSLNGTPLYPIGFKTIGDAKDHLKKHSDVSGYTLYGQTRFEYAYLNEEYPDAVAWDINKIEIAYLDIEVQSDKGFPKPDEAKHPITAITLKLSSSPTFYVWGLGEYSPAPNVQYTHARDEQELLQDFLSSWGSFAPDIVTGWNINTFDIPYLYQRISNLLGERVAARLSPFKIVFENTEIRFGKEVLAYDVLGIAILDYLDLFKKYSSNRAQESYKLNYIASVELGEKKISYEEYETLFQLYRLNHQKFIEYNIHDVTLVERLNAKGRLIELALTLAYDCRVNYEDVFSQVRMWDSICCNHLMKKNILIPPKIKQHKPNYMGAYVKDPQIGRFDWVVSFDIASLYPHLIEEFNLSPETLHEQHTDSERALLENVSIDTLLNESIPTDTLAAGLTITPNKQLFHTEQVGFLPEIMKRMFSERTQYKKKMIEAKKKLESIKSKATPQDIELLQNEISRYNNLQMSKKENLNSAYGSLGNEHFRFFDTRLAEAITSSGQLVIRWIEKALNKYMNKLLKTTDADYIIAMDTDSIYLNLGPLVKVVCAPTMSKDKIVTFLNQICEEKFQPVIVNACTKLANYTHAFAQKMTMKREAIAEQAIWTAKKRYLLYVHDVEGVRFQQPELVIHGLEAIKSSTPTLCRETIAQALRLVFTSTQTELREYVHAARKEFRTSAIEDIAFPRSVNGVVKYGRDSYVSILDSGLDMVRAKGTPIHVGGALVYNHYLKEHQLDNKYQPIQEGEKIKFVYLKEPNIFRAPILSFIQRPPKEWELEKWIDYDLQFEKSFIDPLCIVLKSVGWSLDERGTLEELFQ